MAFIAATGDEESNEVFADAVNELWEHVLAVFTFPPDGHGRGMEDRIREGEFEAVFDFSPVELLTGSAGADRLTAAGMKGIPQLISVCGLDFHPGENRPTTPQERDAVGKTIAERACAAKGPTIIAIPGRGFTGGGDDPLFQSIRSWIYPPSLLVEPDFALTETAFGHDCVYELLKLMRRVS